MSKFHKKKIENVREILVRGHEEFYNHLKVALYLFSILRLFANNSRICIMGKKGDIKKQNK